MIWFPTELWACVRRHTSQERQQQVKDRPDFVHVPVVVEQPLKNEWILLNLTASNGSGYRAI
jgi:hypothetical protein